MKTNTPKPLIQGNPQIVLFSRLFAILLLMMASRMLLFFLNKPLFPDVPASRVAYYALTGLRFDASALLYINLPYILLMLLPFRFRMNRSYQRIAGSIFYVTNAIGFIPNFVDTVYFPFTMKRLTADIFRYITLGNDTAHMMPQFLHDFWYVLLLWIVFVVLMVLICSRIVVFSRKPVQGKGWYITGQTLITVIMAGLTVLGMRGGVQLKPIGIMTAGNYAPVQQTPLVLNSAFTILRTLEQNGLQKKEYFSDEKQMLGFFNASKQYPRSDSTGANRPMDRRNVVIIILESFSKEHSGSLNPKLENGRYLGFTPFLDSLMEHSLVLDGYANGKRSIEGIPAILASLPTWMTEDFITSSYAGNTFNSLAGLLKPEGYYSAFFHGGNNGTMGFDAFCRSAGFDAYFGRNEYGNDGDYDGKWGIWDEPFLQFMAGKLNAMPQPFLASVFTLSSHHPYKIPEKYKGKFRKGKLPIQQSVMYSDYALKRFFETAKKMPWFSNTLFVITADHTSESAEPFYQSRAGQYSIPIIFYQQDSVLNTNSNITAQQTDIMPSILQYLGYTKPFIAFGNSVFDGTASHAGISSINGSYQIIKDGWSLEWDGISQTQLYDFKSDSLLMKNLANVNLKQRTAMENLLKSYIQQYNNRMISNSLIIK